MTPFRFPLGAHVRHAGAPPAHPGYVVLEQGDFEGVLLYALRELGVPATYIWAYEPDLEDVTP